MHIFKYEANAGTGKTTALLGSLVEHVASGVSPDEVAFITFTKAGALVIRDRSAERLNLPKRRLTYFSTIHSMCFQALHLSRDTVMGTSEYATFCREMGMSYNPREATSIEGIADVGLGTQLIMLDGLYRNNRQYALSLPSDILSTDRLCMFMEALHAYKERHEKVDFTDMLELFIERKCTLDSVKYVYVDEAQDITTLQWKIIFSAFKNATEMHIAYDWKQSMYIWAGSDVKVLQDLRGEIHPLYKSYRFTEKIAELGNRLATLISWAKHDTPSEAIQKGGVLQHINSVRELIWILKEAEEEGHTVMLLGRTRCCASRLASVCNELGYNYNIRSSIGGASTNVPHLTKESYMRATQLHGAVTKELAPTVSRLQAGGGWKEPTIYIGTIHSVKGDEADVVVLNTEVTRKILLSMRIPGGLDAEHCVWYVGVTRARKKLYLLSDAKLNYSYLAY